MKRKILSVVLALVMVLSMTAVSFADTASPTLGANDKALVYLKSGDVVAKASVDKDYVVKASVAGSTLDASEIIIGASMQDVASLDVTSPRTEEFKLQTNLTGDPSIENLNGIYEFTNATIVAKVNGLAPVTYTVAEVATTGNEVAAWTATPDSVDKARANYQEMAAHVDTDVASADSNVLIPAKTKITVGKETLYFNDALTVNNLNEQGDDYTQDVLDAVTYSYDENADNAYVIELKEGSLIQVGSSIAKLTADTTIVIDADELDALADQKLLEVVKGYANDRDYYNVMVTLVNVFNALAVNLEGAEVGVTITTDCGENCECEAACQDGCTCIHKEATGGDQGPSSGEEQQPTTPPTTGGDTGTPQTSDDTPVGMFGAIALAAVVAMAGVVLTRKRATER